jgi:hypothetical protein
MVKLLQDRFRDGPGVLDIAAVITLQLVPVAWHFHGKQQQLRPGLASYLVKF